MLLAGSLNLVLMFTFRLAVCSFVVRQIKSPSSIGLEPEILLRTRDWIRERTRRAEDGGVSALSRWSGLQTEGGVGPTQHELVAKDQVVERNRLKGNDRILHGRIVSTGIACDKD